MPEKFCWLRRCTKSIHRRPISCALKLQNDFDQNYATTTEILFTSRKHRKNCRQLANTVSILDRSRCVVSGVWCFNSNSSLFRVSIVNTNRCEKIIKYFDLKHSTRNLSAQTNNSLVNGFDNSNFLPFDIFLLLLRLQCLSLFRRNNFSPFSFVHSGMARWRLETLLFVIKRVISNISNLFSPFVAAALQGKVSVWFGLVWPTFVLC